METIIASEFKAKCLKLMDKVAKTGESIIITKNGIPTAQLKPINKISSLFGVMSLSGAMPNLLETHSLEWNAMKGDPFIERMAQKLKKKKK